MGGPRRGASARRAAQRRIVGAVGCSSQPVEEQKSNSSRREDAQGGASRAAAWCSARAPPLGKRGLSQGLSAETQRCERTQSPPRGSRPQIVERCANCGRGPPLRRQGAHERAENYQPPFPTRPFRPASGSPKTRAVRPNPRVQAPRPICHAPRSPLRAVSQVAWPPA